MSPKYTISRPNVHWARHIPKKWGSAICAGLFSYAFLLVATGWAQRAAELAGTVKDPSGAAMVGVTISATNERTGVKTSSVSNESGLYRMVEVVAAPYKIEATQTGFKTFVSSIVLEAGRVTPLDIVMQVGEVAQTVEVQATTATLETSSQSVSTAVEEKLIKDLPVVIRRPAQLITTVAGVTFSGSEPTTTQTPFFTLAGGPSQPAFYIDGGNATNTRVESTLLVINPNIEVTQEFRVIANGYKAEYGGSGGGLMLMTTKSGTNDIHGTVWEFHRQKALDARNTFAAEKVPFREHTYGVAIGGPIIKNKLHYFGSYEGTKNKITSLTGSGRGLTAEFFQTLPTAAQLNGDFSGLLNNNGTLRTIYDPRTTRTLADGTVTRDPFPGNIIPQDRLSPIAKRIAAYLPAPNKAPDNITGFNNFVGIATNGTDRSAWTGRLDYEQSTSDKFYFRFIYDDGPFQYDGPWPGAPNAAEIPGVTGDISTRNPADPDDAVVPPWSKNFNGGWTHIFSPNLINDIRFTYDTRSWGAHHSSSGLGYPAKLGFPVPKQAPGNENTLKFGLPNDHFPIIRAGRYTLPAGGSPGAPWGAGDYQLPMRSLHWIESLTWMKSNHSFKVGAEVRRSSATAYNNLNSNGTYNFADVGTARNPSATGDSGDAFASFLLDWVNDASILGVGLRSYAGWWIAPYVQDDWKVSTNLTVNLGVRYELDTTITEQRGDYITGFDRTAINPVCNCPGTLTFPKNIFDSDKNNISPRVGFSWNPKGGKTVIRGGFGIFTNYPVSWGVRGAPGTARPDVGINASVATVDSGITPPFFMRDGIPYTPGPLDASLGAVPIGTRPILSPNFMDTHAISSYNEHFNLNVQHQLQNGLFMEVGWLGNMGHHLLGEVNLNQIPIQRASATGNQQVLKPYPQFNTVQEQNIPIFNSTYHALVFKAEKRFSRGLSFLSNYTWAKYLSDTAQMDLYDRQRNKGLSSQHRTGRFVFSGSYDLPAGKGRALFNEGIASKIFGNWTLAGQYIWQSGAPLTPSISPNLCFCGSGNRPNRVGDPNTGLKTIDSWFNLAAFEHPGNLKFGNSAPGVIFGPSFKVNDVSLSKEIHFTESMKLNFRADFFNVTNLVNYGNPSTTIFPAGQPGTTNIIRSAGDPRRIQLGAKFIF